MLNTLARCWQTTRHIHIARILGRPQIRRVLPVDPRWSAIRRLMQLSSAGAVLLGGVRGNLFGSGVGAWESKVIRWTNAVIEAIEPISRDDAQWFGTPDIAPLASMPMPQVKFRSEDELERFADIYYRHAHRVERLRNLLAAYGVVDAPAGADAADGALLQADA